MRIIKQGDPERILPWYLKVDWECGHCGAMFRPDKGDLSPRITSDMRGDKYTNGVTCNCPTCESKLGASTYIAKPKEESGVVKFW